MYSYKFFHVVICWSTWSLAVANFFFTNTYSLSLFLSEMLSCCIHTSGHYFNARWPQTARLINCVLYAPIAFRRKTLIAYLHSEDTAIRMQTGILPKREISKEEMIARSVCTRVALVLLDAIWLESPSKKWISELLRERFGNWHGFWSFEYDSSQGDSYPDF